MQAPGAAPAGPWPGRCARGEMGLSVGSPTQAPDAGFTQGRLFSV